MENQIIQLDINFPCLQNLCYVLLHLSREMFKQQVSTPLVRSILAAKAVIHIWLTSHPPLSLFKKKTRLIKDNLTQITMCQVLLLTYCGRICWVYSCPSCVRVKMQCNGIWCAAIFFIKPTTHTALPPLSTSHCRLFQNLTRPFIPSTRQKRNAAHS